MRKILGFGAFAALALAVPPGSAVAAQVVVKGKPVDIPAPEGYVALDDSTSELLRLAKSVVAPSNEFLATFVSAEVHERAKIGDIESGTGDRYFSAQSLRNVPARDVTPADFAQLRRSMVDQNDKLIAEFKEALPEAMDTLEGNLKGELDLDAVIEVGGMVPFKPHLNTERAIAMSMVIEYSGQIEGERVEPYRVAATVGAVRVNDRVLSLYTYGTEDDLEWTRSRNKEWMAAIFKRNGESESEAFAEPTTTAPSKVPRVLIYAIIGGLAGAVAVFFNARKAKAGA